MKFFLDNCLPVRHARALNETVKPDHPFTHLRDKFGPSTKDEEWIRVLVEEGDWIAISGGYHVGRNGHELRAWCETGLRVFFLQKGWMHITPLQQHSKLALILDELIVRAQNSQPGSGFLIAPNGKIRQLYPV